MAQYTDEELINLGKKALVTKEKEAARLRAYNQAIKNLVVNHKPEFDKLLADAKLKVLPWNQEKP